MDCSVAKFDATKNLNVMARVESQEFASVISKHTKLPQPGKNKPVRLNILQRRRNRKERHPLGEALEGPKNLIVQLVT